MGYRDLRAMRVRGNKTKVAPLDLAVGAVIRVDRMKYRVQDVPVLVPVSESVAVQVYSEDNQYDTLYLPRTKHVTQIGVLP